MNNKQKGIAIIATLLLSGCTDITPSEQLVEFTAKVWNFFFSIGWFVIIFGLLNLNKKVSGLTRTKSCILGVFLLFATYSAFILFKTLYSYPLVLKLPLVN